jgi:outer membrane protein
MKKILLAVAIVGILSTNVQAAESKDFVSIDSLLLMQKSKEGQKLMAEVQKDVEIFQKQVQEAQKEVVEFQEKITKQAKILSKEALVEKGEQLSAKKKQAERELSDREESLKRNIERKQLALREKQMRIANEIFEKEGWGLMIDRNTPGVLFVNNAIDKTDSILKTVDEKFDTEFAKDVVEKAQNKENTKTKKA